MTVGGSKGSISGNFAMDNADVLLVVGSRAVCQSDSSRTGYPNVKQVININSDLSAAMHYSNTLGFVGDAAATLHRLIAAVKTLQPTSASKDSAWLADCHAARQEWEAYKVQRFDQATLFDPVWGREVLTQPAAIKLALDWAAEHGAVSIFDAGDVQANGFQVAMPEQIGQFITDTGASYMGFAASALLATALADLPYTLAFSGDGSFTMNPQILIDAVQHKARGCLLLFDNRRMAAISGLQLAQYGAEFATHDDVAVDYVAWGRAIPGVNALHSGYSPASLRAALEQAGKYNGLSLIHIPVYYGDHPLGGLGAFGRWNVGNWSTETQALRHQIGL
jgi:3D-(3,5/4)-trihydroxycyclohexane-1,2-dione acylhydrolase (decyclizing)